jgi:FkbM family methyltransferase
MNKYFLDCGANLGQSTKAFIVSRPDSKDYKIVCFEPSKAKHIQKTLKRKIREHKKAGYDIEIVKKVVYTYNGDINFFDMGSESSSVDKNKKNVAKWLRGLKLTPEKKAKKFANECFDFSEYLFSLPQPAEILLKLDIEGSEYPVIEHLHATGALERVSEIYLEPHASKINNKGIEDDFKMIQQLGDFNLQARSWNGNRRQQPIGGIWTKEKITDDWRKKGRYNK